MIGFIQHHPSLCDMARLKSALFEGGGFMKPETRPNNPNFSSGPCSKRPGWSLAALSGAALGRSHRAKGAKAKIQEVLDRSRAVLQLPDDYLIGLVPGSDTGAFEMAMWTMLGVRGVDLLAWESFGSGWVTDAVKQLKLDDQRTITADYGQIPNLADVDFNRDVVLTWNGTTSGVKVPNGDWIPADRDGLVFADATSAVFAMDMPWEKIDVCTYSWQKVLGGEGGHGMLILSPRAVERLESYTPAWPIPKVFRLTKGGKLIDGIFKAATINTPSLLCVEDCLDALRWSEEIGGLDALKARSEANLAALESWVAQTPEFEFLAEDAATRSNTSICLKVVDPWFTALGADDQAAITKELSGLLEKEGVAYDINGYRDAPAGLRIWGGATVEAADVAALCPWIEWAYVEVKAQRAA